MFYRHNFLWSSTVLSGVCTLHSADLVAYDPDMTMELGIQNGAVATELATPFRALMTTGYTLGEIVTTTVTNPNDLDEVPQQVSTAVGLAGTRASANLDLPPRVCGLIGWKTNLTGRSFRGRMYTPPIESTSELSANLLTVAGVHVQMTAFANRVLDGNRIGPGADYGGAWDAGASTFGVYSPTRHAQLLLAYTIINGWTLTRKPSYLSSRDR